VGGGHRHCHTHWWMVGSGGRVGKASTLSNTPADGAVGANGRGWGGGGEAMVMRGGSGGIHIIARAGTLR
jgi:hypothetical protein